MELHPIELTTSEYEKLNEMYPESEGSSLIGKRAEEIVKIYFRKEIRNVSSRNTPRRERTCA